MVALFIIKYLYPSRIRMKNHNRQSSDLNQRLLPLKIILFLCSLILTFLVIEIGYRIFSPFPYFSAYEINMRLHGNLSEYDPVLGWKGVPGGKARMTTDNNSFLVEHNTYGFRDIEHKGISSKPAILFLGDSFTYGYEVEFDEMFINLLRDKLPDYEIFNLSMSGYGNDQELLAFENWRYQGQIKLVVLMFCENDVEENNSYEYDGKNPYQKPKPKFEIAGNKIILTGVPVPKTPAWNETNRPATPVNDWKEYVKKVLFKSYFLHDMYTRLKTKYSELYDYHQNVVEDFNTQNDPDSYPEAQQDLKLTSRIFEELDKAVEMKGAKLVIFFIPSKIEIEHLYDSTPYQEKIKPICMKLDITCYDMASAFKGTWRRTYYRKGMHWNAYGHKVATEAIYNLLKTGNYLKHPYDKTNISGVVSSPFK